MKSSATPPNRAVGRSSGPDNYKWIALSNTTIGILMATINSSIVLISLPAIFRGINLNPLTPDNVSYLLWMLMGYMVVTAVLVVSLGRIGDMFGRVKMYNLGFLVFTLASIGLSLVLWQGPSAAIALILGRIVQGIGGALLMANSAAILTDAFPANQRGMALGINSVAGIAGSFLGLLIGGILSTGDWHLVFLVSVPIGIGGTIWGFLKLREIGQMRKSRIDWWGNITFAIGLIALLAGITYGIQPYGGRAMGWGNPAVIAAIAGGVVLLVLFAFIETRVKEPMFNLALFRIPAFSAGNLAGLLAAIGRGGLMFMLIIWLQGIWLPYHGYSFESTPLWAAVYMLPMTIGFLIAGPLSGYLSDRFGPRPFATGGMLAAALTFALMVILPALFPYVPFALLLFGNGLAMGLFTAPNTAGIMNSVPPGDRGVASGMRATFINAGMNLSIGLFFSLMVAGLSADLPGTLYAGLTGQGVPAAAAKTVADLPPVGSLFAAFLGYNPIQELLGPVLKQLPVEKAGFLTGHTFFPNLISKPFIHGMHITFIFAAIMMAVAAAASWLSGRKYVHEESASAAEHPRSVSNGSAIGAARVAVQATDENVAVTWATADRAATADATYPAAGDNVVTPGPTVAIMAAYGANGSELGRALAADLGVPLVERSVPATLVERVAQALTDTIEEEEAASHPANRIFEELRNVSPLFGIARLQSADGPIDADEYRRIAVEAMNELAGTTGGVVVGHGSVAALRRNPRVLRVAIRAPLTARVKNVAEQEGVDLETARRKVETADSARRAYLTWLYDISPDDPDLYHLSIDTSIFSQDQCVQTVRAALEGIAPQNGRHK